MTFRIPIRPAAMLYHAETLFAYSLFIGTCLLSTEAVETLSSKFVRIPELAGKKCSAIDVVFTDTAKSCLGCANLCSNVIGCRSIFYNSQTGMCIGCADVYSGNSPSTAFDDEVSSTYYSPGGCPNDWLEYNSRCYIIHWSYLNFANAQAHCQSLNANVIDVHSDAENNFLWSLTQGNMVWIGLDDLSAEGQFQWCGSNEALTYTNWFNGQPEGGTSENCVIAYNSFWHDYSCSGNYISVCERAMCA